MHAQSQAASTAEQSSPLPKGGESTQQGVFVLILLIRMGKWVPSIHVVLCKLIRYFFFAMCKNEIYFVPI